MTSSSTSSNGPATPEPLTQELLAMAEAAKLELAWRQCRRDPWYWMSLYVRTNDENDPNSPPKLIHERLHPMWEAIVQLIHVERFVAIAKSRQMMMTWLVCAYFLWTLLFRQGTRQFIQSKKQTDANATLKRCADIYNALPTWMKDRHPIKATEDKIVSLVHGHRSEIWAIPEGEDVIRQYTLTNWFSDETAYQNNCAGAYKAAKPALGAGVDTKVILCSSTAPGWYCQLFHDLLDGPALPPTEEYQLMVGLKWKRNARNKFVCVDLAYEADPMKRTPEWKRLAREGYTMESDWQQEMERNWTVRSGQVALPTIHQHEHLIVIPPYHIPEHWPRYSFSDYGIRHPFAHVLMAIGPRGQKIIYAEYEVPGPLGPHLEWLKVRPEYSDLRAKVLDRSCWSQTQQVSTTIEGRTMHSTRSIAQMAQDDYNVDFIPAPKVSDVVKIQAFATAWAGIDDGKPPMLVIFSTCYATVKSLKGSTWKQQTDRAQQEDNFKEELVDAGNDCFDCVSYGLLFLADEMVEPPEELTPGNVQDLFMRQLTRLTADKIDRGEIEREETDDDY